MTEMLTAKEMQTLLQVDRSTIYRMAESGQLPALKVGKQWRFPADQIENWFHLQTTSPFPAQQAEAPTSQNSQDLVSLLPLDCVQLIVDTFADLLGVMLVVTDLDGYPITKPSHACGLFRAIQEKPPALQRCIHSWRDLATAIDLEPQFSQSHLGLLCARAMIRVGAELKGMVVAGCVAPDEWPPSFDKMNLMAEDFGVDAELLWPRIDEVYFLDGEQRQHVLSYLQRIANVVAHIVNERKALIGRLAAIADLTTF